MAGSECESVEKPPKAVQSECPVCLLVLREPYQATCCGKSFCEECIKRVKRDNHAKLEISTTKDYSSHCTTFKSTAATRAETVSGQES